MNDYITMLGTGNALATRCYNTCFTLHGEKGVLLVDAGGGNGSVLSAANQLGVFGPTEILCSYDTYQFSNYDRYDAATFSEAHKAEVRDNQFPIDLEKAYELGKRLVGKCDKNREV